MRAKSNVALVEHVKANRIVGNEHICRAIAVSGDAQITVVGHPGYESMFEDYIRSGKIAYLYPCACGNLGHPTRTCICTTSRIKNFRNTKRYKKAMMNKVVIEVQVPRARAYFDVIDELNEIDEQGRNLLKTAIERFALTYQDVVNILELARSICRHDNDSSLRVRHIAEALNYIKRD